MRPTDEFRTGKSQTHSLHLKWTANSLTKRCIPHLRVFCAASKHGAPLARVRQVLRGRNKWGIAYRVLRYSVPHTTGFLRTAPNLHFCRLFGKITAVNDVQSNVYNFHRIKMKFKPHSVGWTVKTQFKPCAAQKLLHGVSSICLNPKLEMLAESDLGCQNAQMQRGKQKKRKIWNQARWIRSCSIIVIYGTNCLSSRDTKSFPWARLLQFRFTYRRIYAICFRVSFCVVHCAFRLLILAFYSDESSSVKRRIFRFSAEKLFLFTSISACWYGTQSGVLALMYHRVSMDMFSGQKSLIFGRVPVVKSPQST